MKKSSNPAAAGAVHPTKTFLIGCRPFEVISNTVPDTTRESGDVGPVDALSATRSVVEETVTSNVTSPSTVTVVTHWCTYGALKAFPPGHTTIQTGPTDGSPEMVYRPAPSDGVCRSGGPLGGQRGLVRWWGSSEGEQDHLRFCLVPRTLAHPPLIAMKPSCAGY